MKAVIVSSIYLCFFVIRPHTLVSVGKKKKQAIAVYRRNQAWIQSSDNPLEASPIKKTNASNERVLHLILELHNIIAILISFGLIFLRSLVDWEILVVHAGRCVCFCVLCRVEKVLSPSHILINFGFKEQGQKLKDHPLISSHLITAICLLIQYTWGLFWLTSLLI